METSEMSETVKRLGEIAEMNLSEASAERPDSGENE